ncbi:MAG: hypothetical protein KIS92_18565 [Planctomycetota bacterium]|nr:hypothetical protein [Planctomycetota bacterium]
MATPVIVSFDTEDFIGPASDDALLRLARLLTAKKIRGSFCMVGEKARVLHERGRKDVLKALEPHEIGFHSRDHSIHPTIAPRCEELGWSAGLENLRQLELPAMRWVRDIFNRDRLLAAVPPGSNCAPQAIWFYRQAAIPCYAGGYFGARDGALYWYLGALNVPYTFYADSQCLQHDAGEVFERFSAQAGRACAVLCIHPTILVHQKFWDGVNFPAGTNRPREQWEPAPLRTPEEIERAFERLGAFLDRIAADPRFEFFDYERLLAETRRRSQIARLRESWPVSHFAHLAEGPDWTYVPHEGALSAQASFGELAARVTGDPCWRDRLSTRRLPGPVDEPPIVEKDVTATREQVLNGLWRMQAAIGSEAQGLPARWPLNGCEVGPGKFLSALVQVAQGEATVRVPAGVPEEPRCAERVGLTEWKYGAWIYKPGFDGPRNRALARRMSWTLAPA